MAASVISRFCFHGHFISLPLKEKSTSLKRNLVRFQVLSVITPKVSLAHKIVELADPFREMSVLTYHAVQEKGRKVILHISLPL